MRILSESKSIVILSTCVLLLSLPAGAADKSDDVPVNGTKTSEFFPPSFNVALKQGFSNMFTSCLGAGFSALLNGPQCTKSSSSGVLKKDPSCETFTQSETFNVQKLKEAEASAKKMLEGMDCKKNKFTALQSELGCLNTQATSLTAQVGALQAAYRQNIEQMQKLLNTLKGDIANFEEQDRDTLAKLGGSDNGSPGLLKIKEMADGILNDMPTEIQTMKDSHKLAEVQRQELTEQIETRTAVLASECLQTRAGSQWRCKPNGPTVTLKEYMLCRYEQNQRIGNDGAIERDDITKKKAIANRASLEGLLAEIFSEFPQVEKISNTDKDREATMDQPLGILSPLDVEERFGDRLAAFNGKGLKIKEFFMKNLNECFSYSRNKVSRERKRKNTRIGMAQEAIAQLERTNNTNVHKLLTKYNKAYAEMMGGLTGENYPLVTTACDNAKPSVQDQCLDDIEKVIKGLYFGNTQESTTTMTIRGTDAKTVITFECQGVNGCIRRLQNLDRNLKNNITAATKFKGDFITRCNQNIEQFTGEMAQVLSVQSQALQDHLNEINSVLATMGVKDVINIKPVEGVPFDKDQDGLYKVPESVLKVVGAKMNPPMPNVTGETFASALKGVGTAAEKLEEERKEVVDTLQEYSKLAESCTQEKLDDLAEKLNSYADQLISNKCPYWEDWCDSPDQLNKLLASVREIGDSNLEDVGITLNSGLATCGSAASRRRAHERVVGENSPRRNLSANPGTRGLPRPGASDSPGSNDGILGYLEYSRERDREAREAEKYEYNEAACRSVTQTLDGKIRKYEKAKGERDKALSTPAGPN